MRIRIPLGLKLVAVLQMVPLLILPPATLRTISPAIWAFIVAVFVLLGVNLLRRRSWSRLATIFVQGFNILVRLLVTTAHAVEGGSLNVALLSTSLISMLLSAIILYYVDLPDVQVIMQ
ncbi:MAG: hypothetical protein H5T69_02285 [Chloroflexi bacterium]|nr:hypothetical protein [Chloroflexota bacterium]